MSFFSSKIHKYIFVFLVFFTSFTRVYRVNYPTETYFDEAYHVPAVRLIANNDSRAYEWWHEPIAGDDYHDWLHPPLAKIIQAVSVRVFGDNAWGWRLPSVIAGTGLVVAIYFFAKQLFGQLFTTDRAEKIGLLSALLVAIDGLPLVQSRIAMNDIFLVVFMFMALICFSRWQPKIWQFRIDRFLEKKNGFVKNKNTWLLLTGLLLGLGLAVKWSMLLLMLYLLILVIVGAINSKAWRVLPLAMFCLMLLPLFIYLLSYFQMFLQGKTFTHFIELHQQIIWYQTNRDSDHSYQSLPSDWLLNRRPVWYWTGTKLIADDDWIPKQVANIYAIGNPVVHLLALVVLIYQLGTVAVYWNNEKKLCFRLSTLSLFLFLWLPWFLSPRILFYHIYLPASLMLNILLSEFLITTVLKKSALVFWLLLIFMASCFVLFYPHWTGIAISTRQAEKIYFAFPSLR